MHNMQPSHRLRFTAMLLCTTFLVASCGDDDGPAGPAAPGAAPTINSFSATPSSVSAAGDSVELRWRTTGASSVAIAPGVGTVTPADSGSVRTFVAATTTFILTATNAAGSVTQDAVVTAAAVVTITVTGTVVSQLSEPVPNTPVIITGVPPTTTDASGTFTIAGVTTPYNVTIVASSSMKATVYHALTRPDPTLILIDPTSATPANMATVSGTISGGTGFPQPALHTTQVTYSSEHAAGSGTASATTGAYSITPVWEGPPATTGSMHALQWESSSGLPTAFKGYGSKNSVSLAHAGTFAGQNIAMTPIPTVTFSGTVTVPPGYALGTRSLYVQFDGKGQMTLVTDRSPTTSFAYPTPDIAGATIIVRTTAGASAGTGATYRVGLDPDQSAVAMAIPPAPGLSLPVDRATNVDTTTVFSWSPFPDGIHLVSFNGSVGDPDYFVVTKSASTSIPNLTAIGLGLPSSKDYTWSVLGVAPFLAVDDFAGPGAIITDISTIPRSDGSTGVSTKWRFTIRP